VSVGVGEPPARRPAGITLGTARPRDIMRDVPGHKAILGGYVVGATVLVGVATGLSPWAGLGALVAAAYGALVVYRPDVGALTLVGLAPAVSGVARGLPVPGFRFSEVLIAGTSALILLTVDRRRHLPWRAFDWLALAYVVATAALGSAGLIARGAGFSLDSLGTLVGPLQFFLLYRAVAVALPSPEDRRRALVVLFLASVPVALLALLQQFGAGGVRDLLATATDTEIYNDQLAAGETPRATGPFPHWHALSGYLLLVILLLIGSRLAGSRPVLPVPWLLAILAIDAAALVQTATFTAAFGAIGGTLLLGYWTHRLRVVLVGTAVVVAAVAIAAGPLIERRIEQQWVKAPGSTTSPLVPNTIDFRWDVWTEQYFPALKGQWLTGYGPDRPPGPTFAYAESFYIELILRGGLILLGIFVAMMVALWGLARGAMDHPDPDQRVVAAVVATTVLLLIAIHVVSSDFINSGAPHVLWALIGLLVAGGVASARGDPVRRLRDHDLDRGARSLS
jgi:hypothetical protein